jgi:anti-sigma-K factor RskA
MNSECPHRIDVGAYVLDALPRDEHDEFLRHLAGCAACRHDVGQAQLSADTLPLAATPLQPPPELKDRVMAVVRSEAELLRAAGPEADRVTPARRRTRVRPALSLRPMSAFAAGLAVLAIAVFAGVELNNGGSEHTRVIAAKTVLGSAKARVELGDHGGRLVMTGMPRPPAGHVYEVWLQRSGQGPRPSGTFYDVQRRGTTTEDVHGDLRGVQRLLVTVEPKPGSARPTSPPVIEAVLA